MKSLLGLFFAVGALAQGTAPTVFTKIVDNAAGDGQYHYTTVIPNIGQTTHQIYALVNTSGSCLVGGRTGFVSLYGNSSDSKFGTAANQIPISLSSTTTDATTGIVNATGSGVYPKLTVGYGSLAGCSMSVYYSGTVNGAGVGLQKVVVIDQTTGANVLKVQGSHAFGVNITGSDHNPVMVAGVGSGFTATKPYPIYACDQMTNVTVTAGGTSTLVAGGASVGFKIKVCSYILTGAADNATAQFKVGTQTTTPCDTNTSVRSPMFNMGKGTISQGSGLGVVLMGDQTGGGAALDLCLTAGVAGNVTVNVMYAFDLSY